MVENRAFESGVVRIGVEQEFCLLDYALRPLMKNIQIIEQLKDEHFTTELARFNMEINLDPRFFNNKCFSQVENDLVRLLSRANRVAHKNGGKIFLTGILPTIRESDISVESITPMQRYYALNEVMTKVRGKDFEFNINGTDELIIKSDSVLFESCNTSFQVHFQIEPKDFNRLYNWAQYISGPVLASAVNSPFFLGKRLWKETRIAVFQQAIDIRKSGTSARDERPRVLFGADWERGNIVDHYRENLSRYKVLVSREQESNSIEELNAGRIPKLGALALHNGTIYKWNRPCYGITGDLPHLRIENRYLPSGPSIVDEVANAALWTGLMNAAPENMDEIVDANDFDDVRLNFYKAARYGLAATFKWKDKKAIPAKNLLMKELLPLAEQGLKKAKVNQADIDKYLGIIRKRCQKERTGSTWILESYSKLRKKGSHEESILALTEGIYQRQKTNIPVSDWADVSFKETTNLADKFSKIGQVMTKDLIIIGEEELIDLARNIMLWSNIRHVPVENDKGELVGIISSENLLSYFGGDRQAMGQEATAGEIMERDMVTVGPDTATEDVISLMRERETSCIPIVEKGRLVGIFTERDYVKFSEYLFEELIHQKKKK